MPIPTIFKLLKHLPTEGGSRACPVCGKPVSHISDGIRFLDKCMSKSCGYSHIPTGDIIDQRKYDYSFNLVQAALQKAGYFELHQPIEEQLYNKLMVAGRTPEEAIREIITDLQMSADEAEYFKNKLDFLGRE